METKKGNHISALVLLTFISLMIILSLVAMQPAERVDNPVEGFSATRAAGHLQAIAQQPNPIGSQAHDEVRDYLFTQLQLLGLEPQVQAADVYNPFWRTGATVENVLARLSGTDNSNAILVVAHYDSPINSPGAANGKSGVATILEIARALQHDDKLANDVIFLLSDAGEIGLQGSVAFLDQHPWAKDVSLVLSLTARGSSGPVILHETSTNSGWLVREFGQTVTQPNTNSFISDTYRWLGGDSDFNVYKQAGIPGLNFSFIEDPRGYATMLDNVERLDLRSVQQQGEYILSLVHELGNQDLSEIDEIEYGNRIYFDLFSRTLVSYPLQWVAHLLTIILIFGGILVWYVHKHELVKLKDVVIGLVVFFGASFVASIGTAIVANFIIPQHSLYQYVPLTGGLWYLCGLIALTCGVFSLVYAWAFRKWDLLSLSCGVHIGWVLVAVLVSLFFPGASYFFIWPLLFSMSAIAFFFYRSQGSWITRLIVMLITTLPLVILWPPVLRTLYATMGLNISGLLMTLIVLGLGLLLPHMHTFWSSNKWIFPILAFVLAGSLIGLGVSNSEVSSENPAMDTLFYHQDFDTGTAMWASIDNTPDDYTQQVLSGFVAGSLSDLVPYEDIPVIVAHAPKLEQNPLNVTLVSETIIDETTRELVFGITADPIVNSIVIYITADQLSGSVELLGEEVEWVNTWPVLRYYNLPKEGIEIIVPAIVGSEYQMQIVTQSLGLPTHLATELDTRPDYLIAAPTPITDSTLTIETFIY